MHVFPLILGFFLEGTAMGPYAIFFVLAAFVPIVLLAMVCAAIWPPDMTGV